LEGNDPSLIGGERFDGRLLEQRPGYAFLKSARAHDDRLARLVKVLDRLGRRVRRYKDGDSIGRERAREGYELRPGGGNVKTSRGKIAFLCGQAGNDGGPGGIDMLDLDLQHAGGQVQEIDVDTLPLVGRGIPDVPWIIFDIARADHAAAFDRRKKVVGSPRCRRLCMSPQRSNCTNDQHFRRIHLLVSLVWPLAMLAYRMSGATLPYKFTKACAAARTRSASNALIWSISAVV